MARTVNWKGERSHYTGELNGVKLEIQKIPGKHEYSVFVDGVKKGWKYTLNNAKTFAIRCAEGRLKPTPSIITPEVVKEAVEVTVSTVADDKIVVVDEALNFVEHMIPVAEVPTFHVAMSFHYVGETKEPAKLQRELQFHIDAIRALGGEIDANLEITHTSKIKL